MTIIEHEGSKEDPVLRGFAAIGCKYLSFGIALVGKDANVPALLINLQADGMPWPVTFQRELYGDDEILEVADMLHKLAHKMVVTLIAKPAGEKPAC